MKYKCILTDDVFNSQNNFKKGETFNIVDIWKGEIYDNDILVKIERNNEMLITSLSHIKIVEVIK